jgi:hypothetical protein
VSKNATICFAEVGEGRDGEERIAAAPGCDARGLVIILAACAENEDGLAGDVGRQACEVGGGPDFRYSLEEFCG